MTILQRGLLANPSRSVLPLLETVILDLKGSQYRGTFFPCATAMVLTVVTQRVAGGDGSGRDSTIRRHVKLEGITDEFCRLVPTGQNALDQMSATVHGNVNDHENDDYDLNEYRGSSSNADVNLNNGTKSTVLDFPEASPPPPPKKPSSSTTKKKKAPTPSRKPKANAGRPSSSSRVATPKGKKR
jgi:hypothetical protein